MQIAFGKNFTYDRARPAAGHLRDGALPRLGDAQPGLRRPGPGAALRRPAGSPARSSSSAGTSCRSSANEQRRVEVGFLLAAGVLFALLYWVYRRPHDHAEDVPAPGSPEELEARLASIDENV